MTAAIHDRSTRRSRFSSSILVVIVLLCAACAESAQTVDGGASASTQEPRFAQSVEEATASIKAFEREHNEAVSAGIDALLQFHARTSWPANSWSAAQVECPMIQSDDTRTLYENRSDRLDVLLSNPRPDPEWIVPDLGQIGAGDRPGQATWLVDVETDGVEAQMHLAIQDGQVLKFPGGPPCPLASIVPTDDVSDVALVWREVATCRLDTSSWCATWLVRSDGSIATERLGTESISGVAGAGEVDRALVSDWLLAIETPEQRSAIARALDTSCPNTNETRFDRHVEVPSRSVSVTTCQDALKNNDQRLAPLQALVGAVIADLPTDGSDFLPCDLHSLGDDEEC